MDPEKIFERAWKSYEAGEYGGSLELFGRAVKLAKDAEQRDRFLSGSCYALAALRRFAKARKIYKALFKKSRSHVYLHQLGMVEREAGNYEKALRLYEQERKLISGKDVLATAANLYEFGKNNELLGRLGTAKVHSDRCLKISMKCADMVMKGCAFRLAGDIAGHYDADNAAEFYKKAKKYFRKAADKKATREITALLKKSRLSIAKRSLAPF